MFTFIFLALFLLLGVFEEEFWDAVVWLCCMVTVDYYLYAWWIS